MAASAVGWGDGRGRRSRGCADPSWGSANIAAVTRSEALQQPTAVIDAQAAKLG